MKVKEIMKKDVKVINQAKPLTEAAKMMKENQIGSIPVENNERLVGMLTDRDIVVRSVAAGKNPSELRVEDCMSPGINYCFDYETTDEAAEKMMKHSDRRLPVLNEEKRLVGLVSIDKLATNNADKAAEAITSISSAS